MKNKPITVAMEDATNELVKTISEVANKNHLDYFHLEIIINDIHKSLSQQVMLQKQQDRDNYMKEVESQKERKSEKK